MKSTIAFSFLLSLSALNSFAQIPAVSAGKVIRIENFNSGIVAPRNVDVWLPAAYDPAEKYSVIYMHDGQMLFDSTITWNKKEWKVDETLSRLMNEKKIEKCIVVGIWNTGADRISEYFPDKIFSQLEEKTRKMIIERYGNGKPACGDIYLKFLVTELKPYIDGRFSTYTDKDHTFIIGSSMGALISIYAICEYPGVFAGAACLSTAWLNQIEPNYEVPVAAFNYLIHNMPSPADHKIYFDYGTGESNKSYEATQLFVDLIAKGKGFNENNYLSKIFDKDQHNEIAWSRRLNIPVEFLMH